MAETTEHPMLAMLTRKRFDIMGNKNWPPAKKATELKNVETSRKVFRSLQQLSSMHRVPVTVDYACIDKASLVGHEHEASMLDDYERWYQKPEDHVFISRDFLPPASTTKKEGWTVNAIRNLENGTNSTEEEISDMRIFMDMLNILIREAGSPIMTMKVLEEAKRRSILHAGRVVATFEEIHKEWRDGELSEQLCEDVFHCIYSTLDNERVWNKIVYDVMRLLKLWYIDSYKGNSNSGKMQKGFVSRMLQEKKRDMFHKRINRKPKDVTQNQGHGVTAQKQGHGVTLTISNQQTTSQLAKRNSRRPGPGEQNTRLFSMETNVLGWNGPSHQAWMEGKVKAAAGTLHQLRSSPAKALNVAPSANSSQRSPDISHLIRSPSQSFETMDLSPISTTHPHSQQQHQPSVDESFTMLGQHRISQDIESNLQQQRDLNGNTTFFSQNGPMIHHQASTAQQRKTPSPVHNNNNENNDHLQLIAATAASVALHPNNTHQLLGPLVHNNTENNAPPIATTAPAAHHQNINTHHRSVKANRRQQDNEKHLAQRVQLDAAESKEENRSTVLARATTAIVAAVSRSIDVNRIAA